MKGGIHILRYVIHSRLFAKSFLSYIFILMVPIFIFSLLSYDYALQKSRTVAVLKCEQDAINTISLIDERLINIQSLSEQANTLSWVWKLTADVDIDGGFDPIRKKEILNDLRIYMDDYEFVSNMIFFFPKKNAAVSLDGWFDIDFYFSFIGDSNKVKEIRNKLTKRYNYDLYADELIVNNSRVLWLINSIDKISEPRAQLVFLIDIDRFQTFIRSVSPDDLIGLAIYDKDGKPIIRIQGKGTVGSEDTFSKSMPSNAFGWKYEMTFDTSFTKTRQNEFLFLVNTWLITLILGSLAAFILAYVSYSPLKKLMGRIMPDSDMRSREVKKLNEYNVLENVINKLKNDKEKIEERIREYGKYTQDDMLIRLLKGYFRQCEHEDLSYYGIDYSEENSYAVLVISIIERDTRKDEQLQKIMMAGLLIEKLLENEAFHYKIIDILEGDVVVILSDINCKLDNSQINQLSDKMVKALSDIESIEANVWYGTIENGILGISKSYHSAKESANICKFENDIQPKADVAKSFCYPTDWEIQLINNLKMGKEASAVDILEAIRTENEKRLLDDNVNDSLCKSITNTMLRVAFELKLDWLEEKIEQDKVKYLYNSDVRPAEKRWSYIFSICHMICSRTTYQRQENTDISQMILEYINHNYTNPGLSLKEIAQEVGTSLSAASKAFKNANGINFYDYTCRLRMEKAKELINSTKLGVKDICKEVGYENEFSLRRTFLRYEGISISEYRKSSQK